MPTVNFCMGVTTVWDNFVPVVKVKRTKLGQLQRGLGMEA